MYIYIYIYEDRELKLESHALAIIYAFKEKCVYIPTGDYLTKF